MAGKVWWEEEVTGPSASMVKQRAMNASTQLVIFLLFMQSGTHPQRTKP